MPFKKLIISVLCIFLVGLSAYSVQAQRASRVKVDIVKSQPFRKTVPVIGRFVALRAGNVAARIAGSVDDIRVKIGDRVKKGQLLALLSEEALKVEVRRVESELLDAKAELVTQKAQADLSRTELRRQKGLRDSVAFSQARFEDAQKKLVVSLSQIERAKAKIKIKEAALVSAKLQLAYARVSAPYDGVVVQTFTEKGAYLRIGDPIIKLVDDKSLEIEADVPASRISGLTEGREIAFELDNKSRHKSKVRSVLPSENSLTRTRTVRFSPIFSGNILQLAEGQSVTLRVPAGENRKIITVSKDAILKRGGEDIVYTVVDGKAKRVSVRLGEGTNGRIEILSGLNVGDKVVIRGNERLFPNRPVKVDKGGS